MDVEVWKAFQVLRVFEWKLLSHKFLWMDEVILVRTEFSLTDKFVALTFIHADSGHSQLKYYLINAGKELEWVGIYWLKLFEFLLYKWFIETNILIKDIVIGSFYYWNPKFNLEFGIWISLVPANTISRRRIWMNSTSPWSNGQQRFKARYWMPTRRIQS